MAEANPRRSAGPKKSEVLWYNGLGCEGAGWRQGIIGQQESVRKGILESEAKYSNFALRLQTILDIISEPILWMGRHG